jgi:hypothetical protein
VAAPKKLAPGDWEIRPKDGRYLLRGVRVDGSPVRLPVATRGEGERLAATLFPGPLPGGSTVLVGETATEVRPAAPDTDDWGFPRVSAGTAAAVNAAVGAAPAPPPPADAAAIAAERAARDDADKRAEVQKRRRKYASTLCELTGYGYAMGVGMISAHVRDPDEYDVVKPSPKHLGDLGECSKEALESTFGDREIGPWTMTCLLSLGIPLSVFLQSRRKKKPGEARADLKSVP